MSAETSVPASAGTRTDDDFVLAGYRLKSRLLVGSAGFPNQQIMLDAIEASGAGVVTVAMRRVEVANSGEDVFSLLEGRCYVLPNTAGCFTARDAVLTARLAREALGTTWVKLEVIGDRETLYPDVGELLSAAGTLVADGFQVLPYTSDDPVTAQRLVDIGCIAVMPLGSPIGSGNGIANPYSIETIRARCPSVPVILDAGIGTASDAALAMELGCDAVLLNTAISKANDPVCMARAMRDAVAAGRNAHLAGRIPKRRFAEPSSSMEGIVGRPRGRNRSLRS